MLFWDEQMSSDNTMSCGTCHIPSAGGGDPRASLGRVNPGSDLLFGTPDDIHGSPGMINADTSDKYEPEPSFGFGEQLTGRTAPTMIGAALFNDIFWDGRATSQFVDPTTGLVSIASGGALESQAVGPILSDVEMAHEARDWPAVIAKLDKVQPLGISPSLTPDIATALRHSPTYADLFADAFGTPDITVERIAFAIASYERTLIPDQTPFDAFQAGNQNALTQQERMGFGAFSGPGRCVVCHTPPLFSNGTFRNVGLRPPGEDLGRQNVTGNPADRGRFKVPSLRNVGLRNGFFHNGTRTNLNQVVAFYATGGTFADNRDPVMGTIFLPPFIQPNIVAFLTGALTDPRVANELPPFDRPALRTEAVRPSSVALGGAVPGTGGFVPEMIANCPPAAGTPGFKLGIAGASGGASAFLVVSTKNPGTKLINPRFNPALSGGLKSRVILDGFGAGQGFATKQLSIPSGMGLRGSQIYVQWFVADSGARGGFAKSELYQLTII